MRSRRISERARALACAAALALVHSPDASAQFRTPRDTAAPRVGPGCSLDVRAFDFGGYDDASPNSVLTSVTFGLRCKSIGPLSAVVRAGPSANTGDYQDRRMNGPGGSQLRYQLYTNTSRTTVWGDGTRDTQPIVVPGPGENRSFNVHGELFGNQSGEVGRYRDTLVVTVFP